MFATKSGCALNDNLGPRSHLACLTPGEFMKDVFLDSDTDMIVLSFVPARRDAACAGIVLDNYGNTCAVSGQRFRSAKHTEADGAHIIGKSVQAPVIHGMHRPFENRAFDCGIDFLAGPTEVAIVSERGEARFIAADLVAQAEHDPQAVVVFITTSRQLAKQVTTSVRSLARSNVVARRSLADKGVILLASSRREAMDWANALAPEHITVDPQDLRLLRNAGSVFVGDYSPTAAGDYASGPNHVLPTGGLALCRGGLTVSDFLKVITVQRLSKAGLRNIAPIVETLAEAEGLKAHAQSVRLRYANA